MKEADAITGREGLVRGDARKPGRNMAVQAVSRSCIKHACICESVMLRCVGAYVDREEDPGTVVLRVTVILIVFLPPLGEFLVPPSCDGLQPFE